MREGGSKAVNLGAVLLQLALELQRLHLELRDLDVGLDFGDLHVRLTLVHVGDDEICGTSVQSLLGHLAGDFEEAGDVVTAEHVEHDFSLAGKYGNYSKIL